MQINCNSCETHYIIYLCYLNPSLHSLVGHWDILTHKVPKLMTKNQRADSSEMTEY